VPAVVWPLKAAHYHIDAVRETVLKRHQTSVIYRCILQTIVKPVCPEHSTDTCSAYCRVFEAKSLLTLLECDGLTTGFG
jgi:hypothetical protein